MPIRTPESILCGHCAANKGGQTCAGCNLQICEACAADRLSCATPPGIAIELGRGQRLRSVDPSCRWALVSRPRHKWVAIDLDDLTRVRVHTDISEPVVLEGGELAGPVEVGNVRFRVGTRSFGRVFGGLDRSGSALVSFRGSAVVVIVFYTGDPDLPSPGSRSLQPFENRLVTAVGYDITTDRIACAADGMIELWSLGDLARIVAIDVAGVGVRWLGVGGEVLAAVVRDGKTLDYELRVWSLPSCAPIGWAPLGRPRRRLVDLSVGGEIAVGADDQGEVAIIDTGAETVTWVGGHQGGVSALRVSSDATRLVTGGFDRRILVRYRGSDGFATRIETATVAEPR